MSIPHHIKASQGLARSERYTGDIDPAQLPRLQPDLAGDSGPLGTELQLERDEAGEWLRGTIRGALLLQCRRCLEPFSWPLAAEVDLRLVRSDAEEQRVLETAEPYRVEDDRLPLRDIVEDEVLLALPMMPRCRICEGAAAERAPAPAMEAEEPSGRTNPFAALLNNDAITGAGRARRK